MYTTEKNLLFLFLSRINYLLFQEKLFSELPNRINHLQLYKYYLFLEII